MPCNRHLIFPAGFLSLMACAVSRLRWSLVFHYVNFAVETGAPRFVNIGWVQI
jgi:hypothetical protein